MNIGVDTNFLIHLVENKLRSAQIWQDAANGEYRLILSSLAVGEIFTYFLRRGYPDNATRWLNAINHALFVEIAPVTTTIAIRSAYLRHSLGLSTVDSTILATFLEYGCNKMITADPDFKIAEAQNILPIEFL